MGLHNRTVMCDVPALYKQLVSALHKELPPVSTQRFSVFFSANLFVLCFRDLGEEQNEL